MEYLRKYATSTHIYIPMIKRGVADFAVSADWTPVAGDVKVSIDGGAASNVGTLPSAITMGNGAMWDFPLSSGETTGKKISITVVDAATKAVEDQMISVATYGNASAEYVVDLTDGAGFGLSRIDAAISSRMATFTLPSNFSSLSIDASGRIDLGKWIGSAPNALVSGDVSSLMHTITAAVIAAASFAAGAIDSNAIAATGANKIRDTILSDATTFAGANINATISSRAAAATALSTVDWTTARAGYLDNLNVLKIKKNAALNNFAFLMVQSTDHVSPATGLTVAVQVSIDGAAFVNATNTPATEIANGVYKINLAAADLNGNIIVLKCTSATADQRIVVIATEP